jgi:hypothetical protein
MVVFCLWAITPCSPVKVNGRFECVAPERLLTLHIEAYLGHGVKCNYYG